MDDLISRQAAIEVVKHAWAKGLEPTQYLEELPAVQPQRKTGKWIDGYKRQTCSVCKQKGYRSWNYCPNCGAKMEDGA